MPFRKICGTAWDVVGARSSGLLSGCSAPFRHIVAHGFVSSVLPSHLTVSGRPHDVLCVLRQEAGLHLQRMHLPASGVPARSGRSFPASGSEIAVRTGWQLTSFSAGPSMASAALSDASLPTVSSVCFVASAPAIFLLLRARHHLSGSRSGRQVPVLIGSDGRVIHYDPSTLRSRSRPVCRPPFLIERALILCSGCPPSLSERLRRDPFTTQNSTRHRVVRSGTASSGVTMSNPLAIFEDLRDTYLRYLDSPFDLRYRRSCRRTARSP